MCYKISVICFLSFCLCLSAQNVKIDFSNNCGIAYPEVFGVAIKSPLEHVQSFDMLHEYGVKMIRATLPLDCILPEDITLDDYINNVNDVQNPENWPGWDVNSPGVGDFSYAIKEAKKRGMRTLLSISYCPDWLSYGHGGAKPFHRVPKDWNVYQDLYRKSYSRFAEYTDIVGISNEPNFMHIDGSPYTSMPMAYKDMYKYAAQAIRDVNNNVEICGPEIAYNWKGRNGVQPHPENLEFVSILVNSPDIPVNNINVISYHHYFGGVDINIIKKITDLPVYLTEWNASSGVARNTPPNMSGKESLAWVGNNLMILLKQGFRGSCMYTHYPQPLDSKVFGTYEWDVLNEKALPHLNMKSFALLSKSLKLGNGVSQLKKSEFADVSNTLAAVNSEGDCVIAVSNLTNEEKNVSIQLNGIPFKNKVTVFVYEASENEDVFMPVEQKRHRISNGKIDIRIHLPAQSIKGVLLTSKKVK